MIAILSILLGIAMFLFTIFGLGAFISQFTLSAGLSFLAEYLACFGIELPFDVEVFTDGFKISIIILIAVFVISFLSSLIRSALYGYLGSVLAFLADALLYSILNLFMNKTLANIISITIFCLIVLGMSIWGLFMEEKARPFLTVEKPRAMFLVGLIPSFIITFFMILGSFVLLCETREMELVPLLHGNITLIITTVYYVLVGIFFLWIYPEKIA
ncbi:MAG: hypothetical protein ACI4DW_08640 [Lachnospiraceae bacterium]